MKARLAFRMGMALVVVAAWLAPGAVRAADLTVFAAASLKEALDEQVRDFEPAAARKIVVSYAASSALAKQIEAGAPADLFISADEEWMDYLSEHGLVSRASRVDLLRNRLVLIAPAASGVVTRIAPDFPLAALLGGGRLAIADPDHVPAGRYAKSALESLGVWVDVSQRVARTENVRAALALVSRREAPLGIVYRTDAIADPSVRTVAEFPASAHAPIIYPAALTAHASSPLAARFLASLQSRRARAVWEKHGFLPAG